MTLLRAAGVSLAFGNRTIFDGLTLTLEEGERVGLVGVNGSGKSTLMKVLAGGLQPDRGELQLQRGRQVTYLPQEPAFPPEATIASELTAAEAGLAKALAEHAQLSESLSGPGEHARALARLAELADFIERHGGWESSHRARALLDRLGV